MLALLVGPVLVQGAATVDLVPDVHDGTRPRAGRRR